MTATGWQPLDDTTPATVDDVEGEETSQLRYADVEAWLVGWLAEAIERRIGRSVAWCPEWFRHPEAVARLTALWHAWEQARSEAGRAMSQWWLDDADGHLAAITDRDNGPFRDCSVDQGHYGNFTPLPVTPAPTGWWDNPSAPG